MNKKIDMKHSIGVKENGDPYLFKTANNQPIPDDEPVILFRGRDRLAAPMLRHYREQCVSDGATDYQIASMDEMISRFEQYAQTSATMKQPGITKGK
jgi:hypothetical protein